MQPLPNMSTRQHLTMQHVITFYLKNDVGQHKQP